MDWSGVDSDRSQGFAPGLGGPGTGAARAAAGRATESPRRAGGSDSRGMPVWHPAEPD